MDIGPTETQVILANQGGVETVTDSRGRVIEIKRPSRRESMRLMRQWGAACNVEQWLALALMTASVRSIDGMPAPTAQTPDKVEMVAELLGDEGLNAVSQWYQDQPQPDLGAERNIAKKLASDPEFRERLWLVKNGVPYDVAFALDPAEALAHAVVLGEFEGNEFDWARLEFLERR